MLLLPISFLAMCVYQVGECERHFCVFSCCERCALVHFWVPLNGKSQRSVDFASVYIDSLFKRPLPTHPHPLAHSFRLSCARAHYCSHGCAARKNGAVKIPKLFSQAVNREWSILYRLERLWASVRHTAMLGKLGLKRANLTPTSHLLSRESAAQTFAIEYLANIMFIPRLNF